MKWISTPRNLDTYEETKTPKGENKSQNKKKHNSQGAEGQKEMTRQKNQELVDELIKLKKENAELKTASDIDLDDLNKTEAEKKFLHRKGATIMTSASSSLGDIPKKKSDGIHEKYARNIHTIKKQDV